MFFVFEVLIKPGYSAEQYARAWTQASRIMQQAAGARGTRLHRKVGASNRLLAIASWDSKQHRDAMEASRPQVVADIIQHQAEFVEVHVIGEFDDAEWFVDPAGK